MHKEILRLFMMRLTGDKWKKRKYLCVCESVCERMCVCVCVCLCVCVCVCLERERRYVCVVYFDQLSGALFGYFQRLWMFWFIICRF